MNRTTQWIAFVSLVMLAFGPSGVDGQQSEPKQKKVAVPKAAGAADQLVIRVHNVADLVMPTSHYPFRGTSVPTFGLGSSSNLSLPMPGMAPGGGGIGSSMGGVGGFALAQSGGHGPVQTGGSGQGQNVSGTMPVYGHQNAYAGRFDSDTLLDVIETTVDPESWDSAGGQGTGKWLGTLLIVRQTPAAHEKIAEFLSDVRRAGGSLRPVTVQAHWLTLDAKQLADLIGGPKASTAGPGQPVNRTAFDQLASSPKTVQGQVTCFDGQTVHIISGQSHTITNGVNAVVADSAVAYDPKLVVYHTGAMLQVTPTVASGGKHAVLDLSSVFTRWSDPESSIEVQAFESSGGKGVTLASAKLDRTNMLAQQFSTTLRVAVGQPVLVGGMTLEPGRDDSPRLYLIIEAIPGDEVK